MTLLGVDGSADLEVQLERELRDSWIVRIRTVLGSRTGDAADGGIVRSSRITKVRMVEDVEVLCAKLQER